MTNFATQVLPFVLNIFIVVNILLILGFLIGKIALYKYENAVKFYAYFSVVMCMLFVFYFIAILIYSICSFFAGNMFSFLVFPVFIFLPFVVGYFATYEKVHFFTNIQILTLIASLIVALYLV